MTRLISPLFSSEPFFGYVREISDKGGKKVADEVVARALQRTTALDSLSAKQLPIDLTHLRQLTQLNFPSPLSLDTLKLLAPLSQLRSLSLVLAPWFSDSSYSADLDLWLALYHLPRLESRNLCGRDQSAAVSEPCPLCKFSVSTAGTASVRPNCAVHLICTLVAAAGHVG